MFGELRHDRFHFRLGNLAVISPFIGMRVAFAESIAGTPQINQLTGRIVGFGMKADASVPAKKIDAAVLEQNEIFQRKQRDLAEQTRTRAESRRNGDDDEDACSFVAGRGQQTDLAVEDLKPVDNESDVDSKIDSVLIANMATLCEAPDVIFVELDVDPSNLGMRKRLAEFQNQFVVGKFGERTLTEADLVVAVRKAIPEKFARLDDALGKNRADREKIISSFRNKTAPTFSSVNAPQGEKVMLTAVEQCVGSLSLRFFNLVDSSYRTHDSIQGITVPKEQSVISIFTANSRYQPTYVAESRVQNPEQFLFLGFDIGFYLTLRPSPFMLARRKKCLGSQYVAALELVRIETTLFGEAKPETKEWLDNMLMLRASVDVEAQLAERASVAAAAEPQQKRQRGTTRFMLALQQTSLEQGIVLQDRLDGSPVLIAPVNLAKFVGSKLTTRFVLHFGGLNHCFLTLHNMLPTARQSILEMFRRRIQEFHSKFADQFELLRATIVQFFVAETEKLQKVLPGLKKVMDAAIHSFAKEKVIGKTWLQHMHGLFPDRFSLRAKNNELKNKRFASGFLDGDPVWLKQEEIDDPAYMDGELMAVKKLRIPSETELLGKLDDEENVEEKEEEEYNE